MQMVKYLKNTNATQYGIDFTFRIIPRSLKPYKLMTIFAIDNDNLNTVIAALICIKFTDVNSLIKIFSLLRATYDFSPNCVTTDFEMAQIKALKTCELFIQKPYVICCVFHFSQAITRKMKELGVFKKKLNYRAYEILRNLEILAFIELDKLNDYYMFLKKIYKHIR